MDSIRSLYVEMLEELEVFSSDDQYSLDLQRRAAAALEHADSTKQPWPIQLPAQPPLEAWMEVAKNREASLTYLKDAGILGADGELVPHLRPD
jgi:hypothetical protein